MSLLSRGGMLKRRRGEGEAAFRGREWEVRQTTMMSKFCRFLLFFPAPLSAIIAGKCAYTGLEVYILACRLFSHNDFYDVEERKSINKL